MRITLLCLTALLCAPLTAQKGRNATQVVLDRLGGTKVEAQAAFESLVRGDRGSVRVLERVIRRAKDDQVRALAKRALALCQIPGAVTAGLKVGLEVDRPLAKFDDKLKFTITLGNVTAKAIVLDSGWSYSGNVLENGSAVGMATGTGFQWQQSRMVPVGFCGTGAFAISTVVDPWQTRAFTFEGTLRFTPGPEGFLAHLDKVGPHLDLGLHYVPVKLSGKGKQQLRVRIQHAFGIQKEPGDSPRRPKVAPNYRSAVVSNEVLVTLDTRER